MMKEIKISVFLGRAMACCLLLSGCNENAHRDITEERNPKIQKGLEQAQLKRWDEAIRYFEAVLADNSDRARPDLELALIYHQQKKNYVRAIYHYERYLEKRPESEKAQLIQGWINQAGISFAAQLGQTTGSISEELVRLTRENNLLRKQLKKPVEAVPVATAAKPLPAQPPIKNPEPTPVSAKPIGRIQTPTPPPGTYTVLPGDTLSRIARVMYGDSRLWTKIYAANMDKMKNENDLNAGQTIIIPKLNPK